MRVAGGVYVLLGDDRARKMAWIRALERAAAIQPLDRHRLQAPQLDAGELLLLCRQLPAASPRRLVVVDDAQRLEVAAVDALREHASAVAQAACVVLVVEGALSVRHPLARVDASWTVERFERPTEAPRKPFALSDALAAGELAAAMAAVQEQLGAGKDPVELFGLIGWQLQRWVAVKRLEALGYGTERLAATMGLRPYAAQRLRSEVARRGLPALQRLLARCWALDADAKSGRAVPLMALEQLVCEVCESPAPTEGGGCSARTGLGGRALADALGQA